MFEKRILDSIRKHAIKNALDYGKATPSAVMGRILSEFPETKKDMIQLNKQIVQILEEVNSTPKTDLEKEFEAHKEDFEKAQEIKAKESVPKFVLEGAIKGEFATRYAPAPNGYMHIGNAKAVLMADEFAKIYQGKIFLYFDDTNPEKDAQEYVDAIHRDVSWLGVKFDKEYFASDSIETVYKYARQLISQGNAYMCKCSVEQIKADRFVSVECMHRKQSISENEKLFDEMFAGKYKEGEIIARFMGEMKSNNTAIRDPTILRIKRQPHYRQGDKYFVWPTYDLNTPILDSIQGVTDVIRSKEFELRDTLAAMIQDALKLRKPRVHTESRLVITDNMTHKSELRTLMDQKILLGWDDPRLVTITGLKRRGIVPEAIRKFVIRSGMSKTDGKIDISMLLDENRKMVDKTAKHLIFIQDPVKVIIEGFTSQEVKLKVHPDNATEFRSYDVGNVLYISSKDAGSLKLGDKIRFKDLFNVELVNLKGDTTCKFIGGDQKSDRIVQWVSEGNYIDAKLLIPGKLLINGEFNKESLAHISGFIESYAGKLEQGEIVQLERTGVFRLDDKKEMLFIGS